MWLGKRYRGHKFRKVGQDPIKKGLQRQAKESGWGSGGDMASL